MKAYMLIKFRPDMDPEKATHALKEPGIESIEHIMGNYDAVAVIRADSFVGLGKLVTKIRTCPGIQDSMSCPVIS